MIGWLTRHARLHHRSPLSVRTPRRRRRRGQTCPSPSQRMANVRGSRPTRRGNHVERCMTMRMFIALPLPVAVKEDLSTFLEPRQEAAPDLRWALPEQWHLTLAFLPEVADRHTDELLERLER